MEKFMDLEEEMYFFIHLMVISKEISETVKLAILLIFIHLLQLIRSEIMELSKLLSRKHLLLFYSLIPHVLVNFQMIAIFVQEEEFVSMKIIVNVMLISLEMFVNLLIAMVLMLLIQMFVLEEVPVLIQTIVLV
jgi:hypothetical protein